ncbi:MAG TPA: type VI secretion system tube protein Hcp [Tepidisphaeraceae bacterium]|jgi:type VI secretion system secreted protein Hcp|nr:type VI secretion system tube protein Hcp [Tepidisphaeraceae bacterium]
MPVYMNIQGIKGQATETNHKDWIECLSMSSPVARKVGEGAFGLDAISKGSLSFGNLMLTRKVDSSSVPLAKQTALGNVYDSVDVHVTTPIGGGEKNLLEYKLEKACIVSHSIDVVTEQGGPQALHESAEINFSKVTWTYKKYKDDGSADGVVTGWYDRKQATGG